MTTSFSWAQSAAEHGRENNAAAPRPPRRGEDRSVGSLPASLPPSLPPCLLAVHGLAMGRWVSLRGDKGMALGTPEAGEGGREGWLIHAYTHSLTFLMPFSTNKFHWPLIVSTLAFFTPHNFALYTLFHMERLDVVFDLKTALDRAYSVLYDALLTCRARPNARPHKRVTSIPREMARNASSLELLHALSNCSISVKIAPHVHGYVVNRNQFIPRHSTQPKFFQGAFSVGHFSHISENRRLDFRATARSQ